MKKIRIAMLGVAHPHADQWAIAWEQDPRTEICAVWDKDEARGKSWGEQFNVTQYTELSELLAKQD